MFEDLAPTLAAELAQRYNRDVPNELVQLLTIDRKRELKKFAARLTIMSDAFCDLIANSEKIGYRHSIRYADFVPNEVLPTAEEVAALTK